MRYSALLILFLSAGPILAQEPGSGEATALSFSRSMSIPLNALQLFDQTVEAWKWTFGKEPGAKIMRQERETGVLEGTARVNFRSAMLPGREETMGTITYEVQLHIRAGECRVVVSNLSHTGNKTTRIGGIHMGQLMRSDTDAPPCRGLGRGNAVRLHAELREAATARINQLLQTMEGRIRAQAEP